MENVDAFINIGQVLAVVVSIAVAAWRLSEKLNCAKDVADEAKQIAQDAKVAIQGVKTELAREAQKSYEVHIRIFDKIDELKDIFIERNTK